MTARTPDRPRKADSFGLPWRRAYPKEVVSTILIFVLVMVGIAVGWVAQLILGRKENLLEALIAATIGSNRKSIV